MPSGRFQFGLFELDADPLELRCAGAIVHLQAQPMQVLACLVRNSDRIVSREELRKTIWGEQTFVDFERGLNFCISQIRSSLGDDAATPTYIRTVPKQGYQFIAPAKWIAAPDGRPRPATTEVAARPRTWPTALAVVSLAALVLSLVYGFRARHTAKELPIVAVVLFDNETGDAGITRFADELTDNVVERLTSAGEGRYLVIGNAQILRGPRETRDLNAIAAKLHASFVVLGQVQANQGRTRILAHLIHMPDQTHVSVARMDQQISDPLALEAEAAQKIAMTFAQKLASGASASAASH